VKNLAGIKGIDMDKIQLQKFNELNLIKLQCKVMVGCGCYFGFCGNLEHTHLLLNQIITGEFEKGHLYEGFSYVAIGTLIEDKSQKLTINNSYIRDTSDLMRIPIFDDSDLSNDLGGAIIRLLNLVKQAKSNNKGCFYLKPDKTGTFYRKTTWQELYY
jgi:hypothetical protein